MRISGAAKFGMFVLLSAVGLSGVALAEKREPVPLVSVETPRKLLSMTDLIAALKAGGNVILIRHERPRCRQLQTITPKPPMIAEASAIFLLLALPAKDYRRVQNVMPGIDGLYRCIRAICDASLGKMPKH